MWWWWYRYGATEFVVIVVRPCTQLWTFYFLLFLLYLIKGRERVHTLSRLHSKRERKRRVVCNAHRTGTKNLARILSRVCAEAGDGRHNQTVACRWITTISCARVVLVIYFRHTCSLFTPFMTWMVKRNCACVHGTFHLNLWILAAQPFFLFAFPLLAFYVK